MRLRFLGSDSQGGHSPTLWQTDQGTIVVRGYAITDPQALTDLGEAPVGELDIEIPCALLRFADEPMTEDPRYVDARRDIAGDDSDGEQD